MSRKFSAHYVSGSMAPLGFLLSDTTVAQFIGYVSQRQVKKKTMMPGYVFLGTVAHGGAEYDIGFVHDNAEPHRPSIVVFDGEGTEAAFAELMDDFLKTTGSNEVDKPEILGEVEQFYAGVFRQWNAHDN